MVSSKMDVIQDSVSMYEIGVNGDQLALSCPGGSHECLGASLAIADITSLHDEKLVQATRKINGILREVAEHHRERELMLINVGGAVLLVWGESKLREGFELVRTLEEIRRLLRVKAAAPMSMGSSTRTEN